MVNNPGSDQSGQPKGGLRSVRAVIKLADSVLTSATSPERRLQAILADVGGAVAIRGPNRHGRAVVSVAGGTDVDAFLAKLNGRDDVAYAELDVVDSAAGR